MIMNRATPGPSMRRGTFEEGGRTKEEGEMIRGMWSEECGVRIPQISTLMNERRVGAVKPSHIGEGLVRVDVSFASFLCAKEKEGKVVVV